MANPNPCAYPFHYVQRLRLAARGSAGPTPSGTYIFSDLLIPNARFVDSSKAQLEKAHGEGERWPRSLWTSQRDTGIRRVPLVGPEEMDAVAYSAQYNSYAIGSFLVGAHALYQAGSAAFTRELVRGSFKRRCATDAV